MESISTDPDDDRRRPRRMTVAVWRSPLARSADRTEAGLLILVVSLWLIALPIVATAASMMWSEISATAADQRQARTTTTARLLADVPGLVYSAEYGTPITPSAPVSAQWNGPDGRLHTGSVEATRGASKGDPQQIWIDKSGELTEPPIGTGAAAALTVGATVGVWLCWGSLLFGAWLAVRWRLNKRRAQDWDQEWKTIEPVWSGR